MCRICIFPDWLISYRPWLDRLAGMLYLKLHRVSHTLVHTITRTDWISNNKPIYIRVFHLASNSSKLSVQYVIPIYERIDFLKFSCNIKSSRVSFCHRRKSIVSKFGQTDLFWDGNGDWKFWRGRKIKTYKRTKSVGYSFLNSYRNRNDRFQSCGSFFRHQDQQNWLMSYFWCHISFLSG